MQTEGKQIQISVPLHLNEDRALGNGVKFKQNVWKYKYFSLKINKKLKADCAELLVFKYLHSCDPLQ